MVTFSSVHFAWQKAGQTSPEWSLTPFLLVHVWDEARLPCPQNIVAGKVHGSVQVAHSDAETQNYIRQMDSPFGCLQSICGIPQPEHWKESPWKLTYTLYKAMVPIVNFKNRNSERKPNLASESDKDLASAVSLIIIIKNIFTHFSTLNPWTPRQAYILKTFLKINIATPPTPQDQSTILLIYIKQNSKGKHLDDTN